MGMAAQNLRGNLQVFNHQNEYLRVMFPTIFDLDQASHRMASNMQSLYYKLLSMTV